MSKKWEAKQAEGGAAQGKLDTKLLSYCAMATGALLAAPPADASVVYNGLKNLSVTTLGLSGSNNVNYVSVDLDNNGVVDLYLVAHKNPGMDIDAVLNPMNNSVVGMYSKQCVSSTLFCRNFIQVFKLSFGASIKPSLSWAQNNLGMLNRVYYGQAKSGAFNNITGYIGVKFDISGSKHYGWMRYNGSDVTGFMKLGSITGTIIDWAYESTPDTPIKAGQTADATTTTTTIQPTTTTTSIAPTTTTTTAVGDTDGDGIPDSSDNCPTVYNPLQLDANGNGIGDSCDPTPGCGGCGLPLCEEQIGVYTDTDGDNWADVIDNCPAMYNPNQKDGDKDGIGDCCDPEPGCGGCGQPKCDTVCSK